MSAAHSTSPACKVSLVSPASSVRQCAGKFLLLLLSLSHEEAGIFLRHTFPFKRKIEKGQKEKREEKRDGRREKEENEVKI